MVYVLGIVIENCIGCCRSREGVFNLEIGGGFFGVGDFMEEVRRGEIFFF